MKETVCLAVVVASVLSMFLGCGPGNHQPPGPSNPSEAKQALTAALDAWKRGESIDAFRKSQSAPNISDESWSAGKKLAGYELQGEGMVFGNDVRFRVNLQLEASGKRERALGVYVVSTQPVVSIIRSDVEE
jgi:hypothetical protein